MNDLLENIIASNDESRRNKFLLILDIQSEFKEKLDDLYSSDKKIKYDSLEEFLYQEYRKKYPNMKIIVCTRLEPDFQTSLKKNEYVRLKYLQPENAKKLLSKLGVPSKHSKLIKNFTCNPDLLKPLFCWMFGKLTNEKSASKIPFKEFWTPNMKIGRAHV